MSVRASILCRSAVACLLLAAVSCSHWGSRGIEPPIVRLASDTIRLGSDFEGDVLGSRSGDSCFGPELFWTWSLTQVHLSGIGATPRVGTCGPRHFRGRIGSLSPMLRPDEAWVATYYRVVA